MLECSLGLIRLIQRSTDIDVANYTATLIGVLDTSFPLQILGRLSTFENEAFKKLLAILHFFITTANKHITSNFVHILETMKFVACAVIYVL